jgi:ribosomal subunit interface protein
MQIHVNADKNIPRHEAVALHIETVVAKDLSRFTDQVTRVEVHVSDETAQKPADTSFRCMMEARVINLNPVAVTHHAGNMHQAIDGAAEKLKRAVASAVAKQSAGKRSSGAAIAEPEEE